MHQGIASPPRAGYILHTSSFFLNRSVFSFAFVSQCSMINIEEATLAQYERGDYVKVEFPDEATGVSEWMWIRVSGCDDEKELVFGTLDNEPIGDYAGRIELGSELVVSFAQVREHRKGPEFDRRQSR